MAFDYVKFLAENKLTSTSKLNEKAKNLLNENYVDLRPINSLRESDPGIEAVEDKIKSGKIDPKAVEAAAKKAEQGDTTELAQLMVSAMGMKFENEEEDLENEPEDTGMYDFMSKGKSDEFDIDDIEPATKDISSTDIEDIMGGEEESSLQDLESELKALFAAYGGAGVASKNPEYIQKAKDLSTKIRVLRAKQAEEEEEF